MLDDAQEDALWQTVSRDIPPVHHRVCIHRRLSRQVLAYAGAERCMHNDGHSHVWSCTAVASPSSCEQAGDEDGWDEALGYMDACGPGWHLQIARTTSDDGLANESLKSLSNCMLSDSTRSVRSTARLSGSTCYVMVLGTQFDH